MERLGVRRRPVQAKLVIRHPANARCGKAALLTMGGRDITDRLVFKQHVLALSPRPRTVVHLSRTCCGNLWFGAVKPRLFKKRPTSNQTKITKSCSYPPKTTPCSYPPPLPQNMYNKTPIYTPDQAQLSPNKKIHLPIKKDYLLTKRLQ